MGLLVGASASLSAHTFAQPVMAITVFYLNNKRRTKNTKQKKKAKKTSTSFMLKIFSVYFHTCSHKYDENIYYLHSQAAKLSVHVLSHKLK